MKASRHRFGREYCPHSRASAGRAVTALAALALVAGCGGHEAPGPSPPPGPAPTGTTPAPAGAPAGPGPGTPLAQTNCTKQAADPASTQRVLAASVPGDRICLSGDTGRLEINRPGTPSQPIVILGGGKANTAGMNVEADNILVDGIIATRPQAPGFLLRGKNITVQNSSVISPQGGDGDGMRFFGSNIKILHNLVRNTVGRDERHADAIQTFATGESSPASQDILIDGNRFEDIANICLIAEGPNSEAGDGSGVGNSTNIAFRDNYCQSGAGQAVLIDDVTNVKLENNEIVGTHENAFELQNNSTGARVDGNKIAEGSASKVYVDDSSMNGYQGPHE